MGDEPHRVGLRERKKIRTRHTLRRAALRLFEDNGYASTTIEQIAESADVSPSTFFRYFPSKESVLLADDLSTVMLGALAAQPPELSAIAAFRSGNGSSTLCPNCNPRCVRSTAPWWPASARRWPTDWTAGLTNWTYGSSPERSPAR